MTHKEMKKKVYALIEELNPDSEHLTDDPDIQAKYNDVANQVMYELCRAKKIGKYVELAVKNGEIVTFDDLARACGYEVYQVALFGGVRCDIRAGGTAYKIREDGVAEVDLYVYPERITDKTRDTYEFELSADVLEVMPYGVAADLLKSDVSSEYGSIYASRYETMLNRIDPRYATDMITIEGGVSI